MSFHESSCDHEHPNERLLIAPVFERSISRGSFVCTDSIDGHSHEPMQDIQQVQAAHMSHDDQATAKIHHLLHHLHNFSQISQRRAQLMVYMFLCLIYFGVACTLFGANFNSQAFIEQNYYLEFHYTEFWSAFLFTLVEAVILVSAGLFGFATKLQRMFLVVIALNVVTSLIAALLFTFAPFHFEGIAHVIEYSSQILVTSSNFVFILPSRKETKPVWFTVQIVLASCLVLASFVKFLFYTSVIVSQMEPERASHFFEFTGEMVNSLWAFLFALQVFAKLSEAQDHHNTLLSKDE